jgi:hypothetical protein
VTAAHGSIEAASRPKHVIAENSTNMLEVEHVGSRSERETIFPLPLPCNCAGDPRGGARDSHTLP